MAKELLVLEKLVKFAVIGQTVDAFVQTVEPLDRMVKASTAILKVSHWHFTPLTSHCILIIYNSMNL